MRFGIEYQVLPIGVALSPYVPNWSTTKNLDQTSRKRLFSFLFTVCWAPCWSSNGLSEQCRHLRVGPETALELNGFEQI